jgi:hypothetical protein
MNSLYENDCYGWSIQQANFLKNGEFSKLDIKNLVLEIISVGNSERRALESHLKNLLMHLLKKQYQPSMKTRSWDLSIKASKYQCKKVLDKNPGLKSRLEEILKDSYEEAMLIACIETGMCEKEFPQECPWTYQEVIEVLE